MCVTSARHLLLFRFICQQQTQDSKTCACFFQANLDIVIWTTQYRASHENKNMGARGEVLLWCSALPSLLLLGRSYTLVLCFVCMLMLATAACCSCYIHTIRAAVRFVCLYETADLVSHVPRMIPSNRYEDFLLLLLVLLLLLLCCYRNELRV